MASTSPPPRRFKPEPIESTSTKKVRRFAPEPVETTSKSSKRFTPQPIESTTRHSGEKADHKIEGPEAQDTQATNDEKPKPKRRFEPQPVETSTRRSKAEVGGGGQEEQPAADSHTGATPEASTTRRRRFAPEPVEVTSKSSRKKDVDAAGKLDTKPSISGGTRNPSDDTGKPARRKFAPEPVETVSKSSRSSRSVQTQQSNTSSEEDHAPMLPHEMALGPPCATEKKEPTNRRFAPQATEVKSRSSKSTRLSTMSSFDENDEAPLLAHEGQLGPPTPAKPARRRFAPQLMETAKRSRKAGDESPGTQPTEKLTTSPAETPASSTGAVTPKPHVSISTPDQSDEDSPKHLSRTEELVQQRERTRLRSRQHSFKVPTLPDIDSSESEESRSNSHSQSHYGDSDTSDETYKNATRIRESVDGRFSGYLLALAAQAVEKQLREQAAAAFPNSDVHEPVAHYVDRSDSEEDVPDQPSLRSGRPDPTRRDSGDEKWALREMQRHAEGAGKPERGRKKSVAFKVDRRSSKRDDRLNVAQAGPYAGIDSRPKKMIGGHQRDSDLKQMRKAASPPMLGSEIEFPRCASPENARFDVTQGADFLRKQMCYLTEQTTQDKSGLWAKRDEKPNAKSTVKAIAPVSGGTWGKPGTGVQSPARGVGPGGGLWGGFCTAQDEKAAALPSGIQTPLRTPSHTPSQDPFLSVVTSNSNAPALPSQRSKAALANGQRTPRLSSSPPHNAGKISSQQQQQEKFAAAIDERLAQETKIAAEFNDAFVTQVYNYLSLGYPSLARKFDEELSRISRVPVEELRAGDKGYEARGHVKVPGVNEGDWDVLHDREKARPKGEDIKECRRWRALRRYVREWARQIGRREKEAEERGVGVVDSSRAWGMPVRKGSWGI